MISLANRISVLLEGRFDIGDTRPDDEKPAIRFGTPKNISDREHKEFSKRIKIKLEKLLSDTNLNAKDRKVSITRVRKTASKERLPLKDAIVLEFPFATFGVKKLKGLDALSYIKTLIARVKNIKLTITKTKGFAEINLGQNKGLAINIHNWLVRNHLANKDKINIPFESGTGRKPFFKFEI